MRMFDILESAFQRRNFVKIENSPDRDFANKCHWGRKNWYFRIVRTGMYLIRKVTDVGYRWFERVLKEALYWTHQSWLKMTRGNILKMRWISCRTQEWHNPIWNPKMMIIWTCFNFCSADYHNQHITTIKIIIIIIIIIIITTIKIIIIIITWP